MIVLLRFVGTMNAAVWFGGALFYTCGVAPGFSGPGIRRLFGEVYSGVIAQVMIERYFALFYWCGVIAIVHQLAEWVYLGKTLQRLTLAALGGAFCLGLIGGLWVQPSLKRLHQVKYAKEGVYPPARQAQASRRYGILYGTSQVLNFLAITGLFIYGWRVMNPAPGPRFISASKFRS